MKSVKEIVVKIENKPGTLSQVTELLGSDGISILALTVRTEGDSGVLRFVATDPPRAMNILESAGYSPQLHEVIAAELPHHPGGLNALLKPLRLAGINLEYLYACMTSHGSAHGIIILLGVDNTEAAHDALAKEWIRLHGDEIYTF